jgi:hypothetical protein
VLEALFVCPPDPGHHARVEIVGGDGSTIRADITGCSGPPFDQINRWLDRLRKLAP